MLERLRELPFCVGWHYCGAYLQNRAGNAGFRDEQEAIVDPGFVEAVMAANRETVRWTKALDEEKSRTTTRGDADRDCTDPDRLR
jgi:hypothetical protein